MNELKCNDSVFGEMKYRHRWYKKQSIELFEKSWEITIAAKAFKEKPITEEQQKSYLLFNENEKEYTNTIAKEIVKYVNDNVQELAETWLSARSIENIGELAQIVTPKTLLFKQDGTTIMLLDCVWDIESGIGVKIIPDISIGSQDIFL